MPKDELKKKARVLKKKARTEPLIVSAASGAGVPQVLRALAAEVREMREQDKKDATGEATASPRGWRP